MKITKYGKAWWIGYLVLELLFAVFCGSLCNIGGGVLGVLVLVVGGILAVILLIVGLIMIFSGAWLITLFCWIGAGILAFLILTSTEWVFQAAMVCMAIFLLTRYGKKSLAFNTADGTKLGKAIRITSFIYPAVMALMLILNVFCYGKTAGSEGYNEVLSNLVMLLYFAGSGCWIAHSIMEFVGAQAVLKENDVCSPY